jgi:hypothetical protein
MPRSPRFTIRLPREKMLLARAYAKDRGLPLASIASAALMSEVNRHSGRSHLLDELMKLLEARYPALKDFAVSGSDLTLVDVSTVPSPSGEGARKR